MPLRMTRRRWQVLAALAVWAASSVLARGVALMQSERTAVALEPRDVACGLVILEGSGTPKPVMLRGGFSLERNGGAVVVQVSRGEVHVSVFVTRDGRLIRSRDTTISSGEAIRLQSGWFRVVSEVPTERLAGRDVCVGPGSEIS